MKKNPFEVIGITPEMVKILEDKDLFMLIKSHYRVLQNIYHPDKTTGRRLTKSENKKAAEINLSFEKVNFEKDEESFRKHKEQYVNRLYRGLKRVVNQLQQQVKHMDEQADCMADSFMKFILTHINSHDGMHILNPRNIRLGLHDVAVRYNLRSSPQAFGKNYKEIAFDQDGNMFYKLQGRDRFQPVNHIKLIGAVDEDRIDFISILNKNPIKTPTLYHSGYTQRVLRTDQAFEVNNTVHKSNFKRYCLPYLSPEIRERSYLFSIHLNETHDDGQICLEGMLVKVVNADFSD